MDLLVVAMLSLLVGVVAGSLAARARVADLRAERDRLRAERDAVAADAADARAAVAAGAERLAAEREAGAERVALLQRNEAQLKESFQALAQQVMEANGRQFLDMARDTLKAATTEARGDLDQRRQAVEHLVTPVRDALGKVEAQMRTIEGERRAAFATLAEQIRGVGETGERLRTETASLVTALRKPQERGSWGEMQLRRVVELAGMVEHCDFTAQQTTVTADGVVRPDLVVHLGGDKHVVVDAKVALDAYLELVEARDEPARRDAAARHARHLRTHVDALAKKSYGTKVDDTPEFVVMFVPNEASVSTALDAAPDLLEYAAARNVIVATPTTLIAMLRAIAFGWRQEALAANAREVCDLGRELYKRLSAMGGHVSALGKALDRAVGSYNDTVGSLERSVLPQARRFRDLQLSETGLPDLAGAQESARPLVSPELVESAERAREVVALPAGERLADLDGELRRAAGLA